MGCLYFVTYIPTDVTGQRVQGSADLKKGDEVGEQRHARSNPVPRVFSLSNMAAAGEKTLAHSELKRSLIGAFHGAFIRALSLVYSFQNKDG